MVISNISKYFNFNYKGYETSTQQVSICAEFNVGLFMLYGFEDLEGKWEYSYKGEKK